MLQGARRYSLRLGEIPPWFVRTFVGFAVVVCGLMALGAAVDLDPVGLLLPAGIGVYMVWCMRAWAHSISDPERNFVLLGDSGLTVTLAVPFPVRRIQVDFPYASIERVESAERHDWSPLPRWPLQAGWSDANRQHLDIHLKRTKWILFKGGLNAVALRVVHIDVPDAEEFGSELRARLGG